MAQPKNKQEQDGHTPNLNPQESRKAEEHSAIGAHIIHESIRQEGEDNLKRSTAALAWSGLSAGLSIGFSLVAEALLRAHLPDTHWRPLVSKLGYSVGFIIVVLGRQQLFTENTLTPILPLLARRDLHTLKQVLRLWATVLLTNILGAFAFAWVVGHTEMFEADIRRVFGEIGQEALRGTFATHLLRGVFAGWLIALMVWLLPRAQSAAVAIILLLTYLVGLGGLAHSIAGSVETLYLVTTGQASWGAFWGRFFVPTVLGNIAGGVSLVAVLNHAQVVAGGDENNDSENVKGTGDDSKEEDAAGGGQDNGA